MPATGSMRAAAAGTRFRGGAGPPLRSAVLLALGGLAVLIGMTPAGPGPLGSGLAPSVASGGGGGVAGPAIASFTSDPGVVTSGDPVTLRVVATGVPPITYAYTGLPSGCRSEDAANLTCSPTTEGATNVTVAVTDGSGNTAWANLTLYVRAAPAPTLFGLPVVEAYVLVGAVAAAAVVGALLVGRARRRSAAASGSVEKRADRPDDPGPG